jgi:hypothetical protein
MYDNKLGRYLAPVVLVALAALPLTAAAQAVQKRQSTSDERNEVSITVYNQNFGLVREVRNIELGSGRIALEFRDVAAQIEPETVHIRALGQGGALRVLEQNYQSGSETRSPTTSPGGLRFLRSRRTSSPNRRSFGCSRVGGRGRKSRCRI